MLRLLIWAALIAAGVWFWRKYKASLQAPKKPADPGAQPMVRCAHCGVHLPRDRALSKQQQWFCSQEHMQQGPQAPR
ncbi:PP0621 family protein [Pseudomonas helleri]|uniref:PP0621 family protein n=1 Tax=Pseudomonas helleri TaxID=1608996 RepID=UPI0028EA3DF5|nr:PP0621 family protein [Pseudomonas helleri]